MKPEEVVHELLKNQVVRSQAELEAAKAEAARILNEALSRAIEILAGSEIEQPGLLNEERMLAVLNLPDKKTFRDLRKERKIPFLRVNSRTYLYDKKKVLEAVDNLMVPEVRPVFERVPGGQSSFRKSAKIFELALPKPKQAK